MRTRAFAALGLAVVLAGAAVVLARSYIYQYNQDIMRSAPGPAAATTGVVVATIPLRFGDELTAERVRTAGWPADAVPDGAFHSTDRLLGPPGAAARTVLRDIEAGEPILRTKVTGFGTAASLSAVIAPGMRATTIPVNDVNGVAGFVRPGDRVDVLLTRDAAGAPRGANLVTDILLQGMKVLGVDQSTGPGHERPGVARAVTLEVTPVQAQKLTLAQKLGTLSLALRHVRARDAQPPRTITVRDLQTGPRAAPTAADATLVEEGRTAPARAAATAAGPRRETTAIRVVRGLEVSTYEVVSETAPAGGKAGLVPLYAWPFDWGTPPDKLGAGRDARAAEPSGSLVPGRGPAEVD